MRRSDFFWEGARPSLLLWTKMIKQYRPRKKRGKTLKILTVEDLLKNQVWLKKRGLLSFSHGNICFTRGVSQIVQAHCSWDIYLKNKGLGLIKLREVCQFKGVGISGLEIFGPLEKGGENSVGSFKNCLRTIEFLKREFKKRGDNLSCLELSHFHPSLEIIEKNSLLETERFVFNGLSQSDLNFQQRLYRESEGEFSLTIKAVLPFGHSYSSQLFKSSHRLSQSILLR